MFKAGDRIRIKEEFLKRDSSSNLEEMFYRNVDLTQVFEIDRVKIFENDPTYGHNEIHLKGRFCKAYLFYKEVEHARGQMGLPFSFKEEKF